jgi:hypothetical protein
MFAATTSLLRSPQTHQQQLTRTQTTTPRERSRSASPHARPAQDESSTVQVEQRFIALHQLIEQLQREATSERNQRLKLESELKALQQQMAGIVSSGASSSNPASAATQEALTKTAADAADLKQQLSELKQQQQQQQQQQKEMQNRQAWEGESAERRSRQLDLRFVGMQLAEGRPVEAGKQALQSLFVQQLGLDSRLAADILSAGRLFVFQPRENSARGQLTLILRCASLDHKLAVFRKKHVLRSDVSGASGSGPNCSGPGRVSYAAAVGGLPPPPPSSPPPAASQQRTQPPGASPARSPQQQRSSTSPRISITHNFTRAQQQYYTTKVWPRMKELIDANKRVRLDYLSMTLSSDGSVAVPGDAPRPQR